MKYEAIMALSAKHTPHPLLFGSWQVGSSLCVLNLESPNYKQVHDLICEVGLRLIDPLNDIRL